MATIHCKACGASYRYEKEGCCPNCGAYNRPPKRDRVTAEGIVQHMTEATFEKRQHAPSKVCFEEKECYEKKECHEEKVCFEDQARQGNRRTVPTSTPASIPKSTGSTVYAKPAETTRKYNYAAPKPTGPVPHSQFPETTDGPLKSAPNQPKNKGLPIGCLIPLAIFGIPFLRIVISVIREVLSSIG